MISVTCFLLHLVLRYQSFIKERYFYNKKQQLSSVCKTDDVPHERIINAEFSLQSASQNSREIIQRQSGSQIRKL